LEYTEGLKKKVFEVGDRRDVCPSSLLKNSNFPMKVFAMSGRFRIV